MWQFLRLVNSMIGAKYFSPLRILLLLSLLFLTACRGSQPNDPHLDWQASSNTFFTSFVDSPKTLDPSQAYDANENVYLAQITAPPLQYSYWRKPYALEPQTLTAMPTLGYEDSGHHPLPADVAPKLIAYSTYTLHLRNDLWYQPHPAFALNADGSFDAANLDPKGLATWTNPLQFPKLATRQITADDYAYAIKRLAAPQVNSPIYSLMARYIVGLSALRQQLIKAYQPNQFLDLRQFNLAGVKVMDSQTLQIELRGDYQQFPFWLTMTFFAPIPWEVDKFYTNPILAKKNISFATYPVSSGPYLIADNSSNRQIVLRKNPNYRTELFPNLPASMPSDLRALSGKRLPLIDTVVFKREAEALPRWQKFLQGYYDSAGVGGDLFNQAIRIDANGQTMLTESLASKHVRLHIQVLPSVYYLGFNMQDPLVGGHGAKNRALRHAIGIVLNSEYYNQLFLNGQGIPAYGPIPPGIFGAQSGCQGLDLTRYRCVKGQAVRLSLNDAKAYMVQAGYPGGIDPRTHQALRLHFDTAMGISPDERSELDWLRQRFAELGISLDIEVTQANRLDEEMRQGREEIFFIGWSADYPDPENFLMLLYSKNKMVPYGGENASNYGNLRYDHLFEQMRVLPNGPDRAAVIAEMIQISQQDAPVIWLFYPRAYELLQPWVGPVVTQGIANNTVKYLSVDGPMRAVLQRAWNKPNIWPMIILLTVIFLLGFFAWFGYYRRQQRRPGG